MVVAAVLGLGLGVAGGVMLGGQLFKLSEPKEFKHVDLVSDQDENVQEPPTKQAVAPDVRGMLPYMPEWTTWPDFEQVRWVNSVIEWLWPSLTRAIQKQVADIVGPLLADLVRDQPMLDALSIDVFELGPHPLKLGGLKVYDTRDDEVILEAPILFGSSVKLHISARVRVGPVSIYIPLKIEDLTLKATARVTIRPLVETLPCLGAISISLTTAPYVDLVLKAINDCDLMSIPFLHETVCLVVQKVTEGICVYPNVIAIPLMPNSGLPTPPVGMLEIDIKKIEGLKGSGDLLGKGDPYIRMSVLQLNPDDGTVMKQGPYHQTAVKSGKKPVFNEFKRLLLDELGDGHEVLIEVFDHDFLAPPTLMCEYHLLLDASTNVELSYIREPGTEHEVTVHLQPPVIKGGPLNLANLNRMISFKQAPKAGASMGQLFLNLQYVPFFRSDAILEASDNPAAAMEAMQMRAAPKKVNNDMKGVLTVVLTRCADLPILNGSCDSFVELKITDPEQTLPDIRRTEVVYNETSPKFRLKFDFVYISATSMLTATVYDRPKLLDMSSILKPFGKEDVPLGKVRIPIKDVVKAGRVKDSFPLQEAEQGDIHLTLEWTSVERDN